MGSIATFASRPKSFCGKDLQVTLIDTFADCFAILNIEMTLSHGLINRETGNS